MKSKLPWGAAMNEIVIGDLLGSGIRTYREQNWTNFLQVGKVEGSCMTANVFGLITTFGKD